MGQRIYFLSLSLREASRNEDCNAVTELETHNLYLPFRQCKSKIKPWGGWQDHSTLKPSFQREMNPLMFLVY